MAWGTGANVRVIFPRVFSGFSSGTEVGLPRSLPPLEENALCLYSTLDLPDVSLLISRLASSMAGVDSCAPRAERSAKSIIRDQTTNLE
jgi:hypothetical protein